MDILFPVLIVFFLTLFILLFINMLSDNLLVEWLCHIGEVLNRYITRTRYVVYHDRFYIQKLTLTGWKFIDAYGNYTTVEDAPSYTSKDQAKRDLERDKIKVV